MKTIQDKKNGMMGCIVDEVEWVTNSHWAYLSKYVTMPEIGLREFARGNNWSTSRHPIVESKSLAVVLKSPDQERPGRFSDVIHAEWGTKGFEARIVLSEDGKTFAAVRESFIVEAAVNWLPRLSSPVERVSLWLTIKDEQVLQAVLMPLRLTNPPGDLGPVVLAMTTEREK